MPWFVYILRCNDGSLYTGITSDIEKRFKKHQSGKGAKYTRSRGAQKILYAKKYPNRQKAASREYKIKQLSRAEKIRLVLDK